jgi:hypothetical protein
MCTRGRTTADGRVGEAIRFDLTFDLTTTPVQALVATAGFMYAELARRAPRPAVRCLRVGDGRRRPLGFLSSRPFRQPVP